MKDATGAVTGEQDDDTAVSRAAAPPEGARTRTPRLDESDGERRQRIVSAAYTLLDEAGLAGLTIRAVLGRTGLSRRAYYECFAGKDDLALAVFEHTIRLAAQSYRAQSVALPDALARLRAIVTSIVVGRPLAEGHGAERKGAEGKGAVSRIGAAMSREHLRLAESRPADLRAALAPLTGLLAELLADGIAAGLVRPADPHALATMSYNLVSTTVHIELLANEDGQRAFARRIALADEIWEFIARAVRA